MPGRVALSGFSCSVDMSDSDADLGGDTRGFSFSSVDLSDSDAENLQESFFFRRFSFFLRDVEQQQQAITNDMIVAEICSTAQYDL